jgi:hypothetical protein
MHHSCTGRRLGLSLRDLSVAGFAGAVALPAAAQQATLSLEQIERKYPQMSIVHIEKCDHDRDGQFTKSEQLCVAGIYQAMYLDRD